MKEKMIGYLKDCTLRRNRDYWMTMVVVFLFALVLGMLIGAEYASRYRKAGATSYGPGHGYAGGFYAGSGNEQVPKIQYAE